MFHVDFPDLKYRTRNEIITAHPKVFAELPVAGFDPQFKNPCWQAESPSRLACLPYAYILGQPKCECQDVKKYDGLLEVNLLLVPYHMRVGTNFDSVMEKKVQDTGSDF
eukprot:gene26642-33251_t